MRPCAPNADCEVKDELPLRVMVCTCRPGYSGRGDERCELISKIDLIQNFYIRYVTRLLLFYDQGSQLTLGVAQIESAHHLVPVRTGDV